MPRMSKKTEFSSNSGNKTWQNYSKKAQKDIGNKETIRYNVRT